VIEVGAIVVGQNPATGGQPREFDEGNIFLMAEGAAIENVALDAVGGGN
jgi:hypothetical protein